MADRLLVVEDAFTATGRGTLVSPRFTAEQRPPSTIALRLRFPDGSTRDVVASVDVAHGRGALAPWAMYRLFDIAPEEIPAGTEIWSIDPG